MKFKEFMQTVGEPKTLNDFFVIADTMNEYQKVPVSFAHRMIELLKKNTRYKFTGYYPGRTKEWSFRREDGWMVEVHIGKTFAAVWSGQPTQ